MQYIESVNKNRRAGLIRLLFAACAAWLFTAIPALALTWQWQALPDRERIVVNLDVPGSYNVERTDRQSLELTVSGAHAPASALAPIGDNAAPRLVAGVAPSASGLRFDTLTPAFGYIVTNPDPNRVVIDFFDNPLGARWRPQARAQRETPETPRDIPVNPPATPAATPRLQTRNAAPLPAPPTLSPQNAPTEEARRATPPQAQRDFPTEQYYPVNTATAPEATAGRPVQNSGATGVSTTRPPFARGNAAQDPAPVPGNDMAAAPYPAPTIPANQADARNMEPVPVPNGGRLPIMRQPATPAPNLYPVSGPESVSAYADSARGDIAAPAQPGMPRAPEGEIQNPRDREAGIKAPKQRDVNIKDPKQREANIRDPKQRETPVREPVGGAVRERVSTPEAIPALRSEPGENGRFAVRPQEEAGPDASAASGDVPLPDVGEPRDVAPEPDATPIVASSDTEQPVQQYDKDGKPIPLPPNPVELLLRARIAANNGDYKEASQLYSKVTALRASKPEHMEEALYGVSDMEYALAKEKNDLSAQYSRLMGLTEEAMNYNLKSSRVPGALLRLGYLSMLVGNELEAQAYFNLLRREYPNDESIPSTYYYWGDHFFQKKEWNKAADEFQTIVQKYPNSPYAREAAVNLSRALYHLEYFEQANQIIEYVEMRWPQFYTEYPAILGMMGAMATNLNKFDSAKSRYWTYYNIDPDGDEADMVLSRIGDIYLKQQKPKAAKEVYEEALRRFPKKEGGIIALLRLSEEGIYDAPDMTEMNVVFDRPYNLRPVQAYTKIIRDFPDSGLAPLAQIKLGMWYLWNNQFPEALTAATNFLEKYPKHELRAKAEEVAMKAYDTMVAECLRENNTNRILQIWDEYPIVRNQQESMPNQTRLALAMSQWKNSRGADALRLLEPLFRGVKQGEDSEAALALALTIYMGTEQWDGVEKLALRVQDWELTPKARESLEYAQALAYENLDQPEKSLELWQRLHGYGDLPLDKRTYMLYFLARAAKAENDLENAYFMSRDALRGFLELAENDPKSADTMKIKDTLITLMDIAERAGRTQEALEWAGQYRQYVNPGDEEYPAMQYRFARLYKKTGAMNQWSATLNQLVKEQPDSFYGRMAASELRTQAISDGAAKFSGP